MISCPGGEPAGRSHLEGFICCACNMDLCRQPSLICKPCVQEGDLPDVDSLVGVMAALCQPSSRCMVAFECREAALKTQLLAAAGRLFGKVCSRVCIPGAYRLSRSGWPKMTSLHWQLSNGGGKVRRRAGLLWCTHIAAAATPHVHALATASRVQAVRCGALAGRLKYRGLQVRQVELGQLPFAQLRGVDWVEVHELSHPVPGERQR